MEDTELPIQHGGTTLSAEDQKKPLSVTSCLLPARSLRSTAAVAPAAHAQSQADGDLCIRSLSFSKLFSFRMARAPSSLSTPEHIDQIDPDAAASNCSALTPVSTGDPSSCSLLHLHRHLTNLFPDRQG
jgi:hypothetical protein